MMTNRRSAAGLRGLVLGGACAAVLAGVLAPASRAAITFDGGGGSNWWFDPNNWSSPTNDKLPPTSDGTAVTDTQINSGWNVDQTTGAGDGVVYDPANDPFFANAANLQYPSGFGPQTINQLYISRNANATGNAIYNALTIKSGNLEARQNVIIGRSGGGVGKIVQTGGTFRNTSSTFDISHVEDSGFGTGAYDYFGGTFEALSLRMSHGSTTNNRGVGGPATVVIRNTGPDGHFRVNDYASASFLAANGDGVRRGLAVTEFHVGTNAHGTRGVRAIQVNNNLSINNQTETPGSGTGTRRSKLGLVLDEAPAATGAGSAYVPANLGLFDVDSDGDGAGQSQGNGDKFFYAMDGTPLPEGATFTATRGGYTFNWTITYTGNIAYTDRDNSLVSAVTGPGTGKDVVLVGVGSNVLGGDVNADGFFNTADLDVLLANLGQSGKGFTDGDANGDGRVSQDDLALFNLRAALYPGGVLAGAVPEPASVGAIAAGAACLLGGRRRGRRA